MRKAARYPAHGLPDGNVSLFVVVVAAAVAHCQMQQLVFIIEIIAKKQT